MTKRSIYIFYVPTRGLEADKMVNALNRLDQADALVEQILGDRAKLEHHANRGHAQSNSHAQAYPMEAETTTPNESNHYPNHEAASDTESDQLDPGKLMMTAIPWWTKTGPLWYPSHGVSLSRVLIIGHRISFTGWLYIVGKKLSVGGGVG